MANKKETPDVSLASEKSKAKQQRLALIAGLTITFGIVLIIVLIFMQKSQIEENNVVTTMSIDKLQENVDTLDSSTEELRTQLEGMLEQLNSMDSIIQTNKATVESINTTATGSGENIARAEKDILALQKTLSEYIKQFESETTNTNTEIKEQFNTVNSDVEKLLQEINNNNDNQTTNYKELSSQMDKTLKDMNSFIEKLSKENDTQYKELTKQTEEFETKLNEYLETFNSELNATIKEDIDGVNTHLDTVQNDIATTKKEITDLLNDIDNKQTQDLQTKFDAIQKHLNDMTTHYDEVLAEIKDLINKLSEQNAQEFEDTINKLTSVQTDLTTLNNDIASDMNTTLSNMQKDYTKQITDLQTNVNNSFDNVETQIANTNSEINEKLDTQNSYLDEKFESMSATITNNFNTQQNDTDTLIKMLSEYQQKVDQSFTSVANGKKMLASALATKMIYVPEDATFKEISDKIRSIETEQNLQEIVTAGYEGATVTYTLVHQHVDGNGVIHTNDTDFVLEPGGCYTQESTYTYSKQVLVSRYSTPHCERVGDHYVWNADKGEMEWHYDGRTECNGVDWHEQWETRTFTDPCYRLACNHTFHDSEGTTTDANEIKETQVIKSISVDLY